MFFATPQGETQGAVCAILIDRTGSSRDARTEKSYENLADRTIQGCRAFKASLAIYYFNNDDARVVPASDKQPFLLFRPPTHRKSLGKAKLRDSVLQARLAVRSVFADRTSGRAVHGSDILTAVERTAETLQQLAAHEGVTRKYLVVLTDGYQTGSHFNLRRMFRHGTTPAAAVREAKKLDLIPELDGVQTSFVGVGGGIASSHASAAMEEAVKNFWIEVARRGGGRMCLYSLEPLVLPGKC